MTVPANMPGRATSWLQAGQIASARRSPAAASSLYLLPLVLTLIGCTVSWHQASAWQISLQGDIDPERRYLFGTAYALAALLCLRRSREAIGLLKQSWPYLILLLYMAASAAWSLFPLKVMIVLGHAVGTVAVVLATVMAVRTHPGSLYRALALVGGLILLASVGVVIGAPERGVMTVGGTVRWVGLTAHPNTLGLVALITAWAATAVLLQPGNRRARIPCVLAIGIAGVSVYGANSVTAGVLCLAVVTGMPFLAWLLERAADQRVMVTILLFCLILVMAFIVNLLIPEIVASELFLRIVGRSPTLTGRTELWEVAYAAIRKKPLMGWSFDSLQSLGGAGSSRIYQFHNGYLDVLVRGGWLGLSLVIWLVVLAARRLVRVVTVSTRIWAPLAMLFIVVLLHNITEASLVQSPGALWLLFTLLIFLLPVLASLSSPNAPSSSWAERQA